MGPPVLLNSIIGTPGGRYMRLVISVASSICGSNRPAHLVGVAGYPADPRPPPGSLLNGGAGEHRPAPWQRVHDLPRDKP